MPINIVRPHKLVILESPFAGDIEDNIKYARACLKDSLLKGEAPICSHLLYPQQGVLDDTIPEERSMGIRAGLAWIEVAHASVVYMDRGISMGMHLGIRAARNRGIPVHFRKILPMDENKSIADIQIEQILKMPARNYAPWPDGE